MKRYRTVHAKPGELKVAYGIAGAGERPDVVYAYGGEGACKADGYILGQALEGVKILDGKTLRQLLEERGYDIRTLRVSVKQAVKEP